MTQICFVWLWLVFGRSPKFLFLEDGQRIPLRHGYRITRTAFCYKNFREQFFLVPNRLVDFQKTYALPKKPKLKPPGPRSRHEIPWDHPNFRDKMSTRRVIEITDGDLKTYGRRRTKAEKQMFQTVSAETSPGGAGKPVKKKPNPAKKPKRSQKKDIKKKNAKKIRPRFRRRPFP